MSIERVDLEQAVREQYSQGAAARVEALCCPVTYEPRYLQAIPQEILERDYGCGDPSRYVREGEVVLDLGSGGGKVCYIAAQMVGPRGRVIGIDFNEEMLALARRHRQEVARRIGYDVVEFRKGRIEDLRLDYERVGSWLREHPVDRAEGLLEFERQCRLWRLQSPLVPDASVDLVLSNCVLNLVRDEGKLALFPELYRVLKPGGRAAISDIVSDEPVPERLKADPELWSGCISGAFQEAEFVKAFEAAGFQGLRVERYESRPWRVVEGIEFRAVTVQAWKGQAGPCLERQQALLYRGPWREVLDDEGHRFRRGERTAVCDRTYRFLTGEPYAGEMLGLEPLQPVPLDQAPPFDCGRLPVRDPRETKGSGPGSWGARAQGDEECRPGRCC